ncbi:MAG TPA: hypothetical protein VJ577_22105 [Burkholderiaceae bacterium]|nr:hypothetical protein [Burkholderiaceae bacterium]
MSIQTAHCVAAVLTTYKPDAAFRSRIAELPKLAKVIVVDNTPGGHRFSSEDSDGLVILQDGCNKGLGKALNLGIKEARRLGCEQVILFDQDSTPSADFACALLDGLRKAGYKAAVGPKLIDDQELFSPRVESNGTATEVSYLATSGMAFNISCSISDKEFAEDLFLDFVDMDWCWRMRYQEGWKFYCLDSVLMPHRLGLAQRKLFGVTYHVPPPYRHYFQFRDTFRLTRRNYAPSRSRWRLRLILLPKLLVYPFILGNGAERVLWMARGIRDAILAVKGIGAADHKLQRNS